MTNEIKDILDMIYNEYPIEVRMLEKYITNLQNEIFDLKDTIQNKNDCIGAYECIIEDRDKRIDKAVEYIKNNFTNEDGTIWHEDFKDIYDILRGDE